MSMTFAIPRPRRADVIGVAIPLLATAAAVGVGLILVAITSNSVGDAVEAFLDGALGSPYSVGASLNRAVALALVGLGFILANQANLTNVGGEGQIAVGGTIATALALAPAVAGLPIGLAVVVPLLGGAAAGAVWGGVAGWLKARFGTNEVISTLLLTFIAVLIVYWSVQSEDLLRQPRTSSATLPESLEIPASTKLPLFSPGGESPLHIGIILAVIAAVIVALLLRRSAFGLRLRAVGLNETAARRAGIDRDWVIVIALAAAGALGGLAGAIMLTGEQYYLKAGFSSGYGFDGLVVGLLSRGSALGVIVGALFFGFLRSGGISMEITAGVPAAVVLVIQGLIVIAVAGSVILTERLRRR